MQEPAPTLCNAPLAMLLTLPINITYLAIPCLLIRLDHLPQALLQVCSKVLLLDCPKIVLVNSVLCFFHHLVF